MNELEQKIYQRLSQDAISRGLYALQDQEDVEILDVYKNENFKFPEYEEIAAKEVFDSIRGVLNRKANIVIEHKFGKLKTGNKYFTTMKFDTDEHAKMFLDNELNQNTRLFPNVEVKYLEEQTLIAILGVK